MTDMFHALRTWKSGRFLAVWALAASSLILGATAAEAAAPDAGPRPPADLRPPPTQTGSLRYDTEYPVIHYGGTPHDNAFAQLQGRMDRGEVKLQYTEPRGFLDSLLKALGIDPSSQTLVYSKTSLQFNLITAATPRAIYFNEDAYVAWTTGTKFLELMAMDAKLGPVFYLLQNGPDEGKHFDREINRCLTCHDTFSNMGGGVPQFRFMSTLVNRNGEALTDDLSIETTDQTPLQERWGGWYVTGHQGKFNHLGNIQMDSARDLPKIDHFKRGNLDNLDGLFDTHPYLTNKSDIVALIVFEHQTNVEDLITRLNFKARTLVDRDAPGSNPASWDSLDEHTQKIVKSLMEPLIRTLLFVDAAGAPDPIASGSGFDKWFQAQGARDAKGRSLRQLDLRTRLFKYPLSYMIYSRGFRGLPPYCKDYLYRRISNILRGRDLSPTFARIGTPADKAAALEILRQTKPDFAKVDTALAAGASSAAADSDAHGGSTATAPSPSTATF
jgi:hypothetical protein